MPELEGQLDLLDLLTPQADTVVMPYAPGPYWSQFPGDLVCTHCGHPCTSTFEYGLNHAYHPSEGTCCVRALTRNHARAALTTGPKAWDTETNGQDRGNTQQTLRRAVAAWGHEAHEFIPATHWPETP